MIKTLNMIGSLVGLSKAEVVFVTYEAIMQLIYVQCCTQGGQGGVNCTTRDERHRRVKYNGS